MRTWTPEEADAHLADLTARVARLRELVASARRGAGTGNGHRPSGNGSKPANPGSPAAAAIREELAGLQRDGIVVRDLERGLLDFAAVSPSGRDYWLCWVVGEPAVEWWHWPEDGFAGRTPLSQPPD